MDKSSRKWPKLLSTAYLQCPKSVITWIPTGISDLGKEVDSSEQGCFPTQAGKHRKHRDSTATLRMWPSHLLESASQWPWLPNHSKTFRTQTRRVIIILWVSMITPGFFSFSWNNETVYVKEILSSMFS